MPRAIRRALRALVWTAVAAVILWLAIIQMPLWLMRLRVQHLLADFHSLHSMQSPWPDAQRLMTRWGRFGHYNGTCTPAACTYQIEINDPIDHWIGKLSETQIDRLDRLHLFLFAERLGWHASRIALCFSVEAGIVTRLQTGLSLQAPDTSGSDPYGETLMFGSEVRSHLRVTQWQRHTRRILGNDEQLGDHPDYKIGRPGGCEISCELAEFAYTPTLAHSEVVRLTSYNLSCITHFRACPELGDVLPAARDWHLYDHDNPAPVPNPTSTVAPISCRTVPRALGRDAAIIIEAEALSEIHSIEHPPDDTTPVKLSRAKIIRIVKGTFPATPGNEIIVFPFDGAPFESPAQLPEYPIPGRRYFILLDTDYRFPETGYQAPRCGILDDTPTNLQQLLTGIAEEARNAPAEPPPAN